MQAFKGRQAFTGMTGLGGTGVFKA